MRKRSTVCGSAYVFALGPDCNDNGDADFCDIRDGASRDDNDNGIPDDCEVVQVVIDIRPRRAGGMVHACVAMLPTRSGRSTIKTSRG